MRAESQDERGRRRQRRAQNLSEKFQLGVVYEIRVLYEHFMPREITQASAFGYKRDGACTGTKQIMTRFCVCGTTYSRFPH